MNKFLKYTLIVLFLLFLGLYFSSNAGYQAKYKKNLTEQEIRNFEEDLNNGVNIDIKEYTNANNKNFSNPVSRTTLKISNTIGDLVKCTLDFMFKQIEKNMSKE